MFEIGGLPAHILLVHGVVVRGAGQAKGGRAQLALPGLLVQLRDTDDGGPAADDAEGADISRTNLQGPGGTSAFRLTHWFLLDAPAESR
jgi:hypothetical protein